MRPRLVVLAALAAAFACDSPPTGTDSGAMDGGALDAGALDAGDEDAAALDAAVVDAGPPLAFGCTADDLDACHYRPERLFAPGSQSLQTFEYTTEYGDTRRFQVDVRLPEAAALPAPVIVWSHGGAGGQAMASNVGFEWSRRFVAAGYAFVAIGHAGRDRSSYDALCLNVGFSPEECAPQDCTPAATECTFGGMQGTCVDEGCRYWKHLSYDRPNDFAHLIEQLETASASGGAFDGVMDLDRLIYAGHSAGAGSTMMAAGATRMIGGVDRSFVHERPVAFLSFSPQPSDDDGFTPQGYSGAPCLALGGTAETCLTRPHMVLTGVGDGDLDEAVRRREAYDLPPAGARWLVHFEEHAARHNTFNHEVDACATYARQESLDPALYPERCASYLEWLDSAALAFVDANARQRPEAIEYLAGGNLTVLGQAAFTYERR